MQCTDNEITKDAPAAVRLRRECRLWLSALIQKDRTMRKTKTIPEPVACPNCHEPLVEPHDLRRCQTIAHEFAMELTNTGDEVSFQIVALVRWLQRHPAIPQGRGSARRQSARLARQDFLDHYVKLAQK